MLEGIESRLTFLDRFGHPIDVAGHVAVDQFGKNHRSFSTSLTSIIIISAERSDQTSACVESIFDHTKKPFEIIISDVGSSRETQELLHALEDEHPNLHVIYNKESSGTTGQRNQGIHLSKGGYLVFMDNDVLVLPNWLDPLQQRVQSDSRIGMVGAKLLTSDGQDVYYCGIHTITLEKYGNVYGIGLDKSGQKANLSSHDSLASIEGRVPWYTTTTLLAKREVIYGFGGFDDIVGGKGIFIASEDKDLSLSCRQAGFSIHYCTLSEVIHNHDYRKIDRSDKYHSTYRLRMEQIAKDTSYFVSKWNIKYMIEKLPHEDNTKEWKDSVGDRGSGCHGEDEQQLQPVKLNLASPDLSRDIVTVETLNTQ